MTIYDKIAQMKTEPPSHWFDPPEVSYWGERAFAQIAVALSISKKENHQYDALIEQSVDLLYRQFMAQHAVTDDTFQQAEQMLLPLRAKAKEYTMHCVAHAHLDMDWMWGYHETVGIVTDTFRTMLDLMKEYPDFTFSQSQAATYELVEKYDPAMFEEIKERIHEGRWEFAGSTWVELDKNLPSGESMARHILYTKRYLHDKLGIAYDQINQDFHPDSFGHSISIPEIFKQGGIKYFYHCRGVDGRFLYRWQSPSGATVLACNEPLWYNDSISAIYLSTVIDFCDQHGIKDMMKVYGVGDHGGGPTRKDLERILDMQNWPLAPVIKFSSYEGFFTAIAPYAAQFPIYQEELGPTFTGCYTSESQIKTANRIMEDRMYAAETLTTLSSMGAGGEAYREQYQTAWQKLLFNHFHDILPGSGVAETKNHALGNFEEVLAAANTGSVKALRAFVQAIDTSAFPTPDEPIASRSEGGGVGFAADEKQRYRLPSTERGRGKTRIVHLFNPTQFDRREVAQITLWDWNYRVEGMQVKDTDGNLVAHQWLENAPLEWNHNRTTILMDVSVPAFGYRSYIVSEKERDSFRFVEFPPDPRKSYYHQNVLENEQIRAVFDENTLALVSLTDLETGAELVDSRRPAGCFYLAYENDQTNGGGAWVEGVHTKQINLNQTCKVLQNTQKLGKEKLRQQLGYTIDFANSHLTVTITLDRHTKLLRFAVCADWHEASKKGEGSPKLLFKAPFAYEANTYRYDIQFASIDRKAESLHDSFGRNYIYAIPQNGSGLALLTDTKYGYRGYDNTLQVSILRASSNPNKYPEIGLRYVQIGVGVVPCCKRALLEMGQAFTQELPYATNTAHGGRLPMNQQLIKVSDNIGVTGVKLAQDDDAVIMRVYNLAGKEQVGTLTFAQEVQTAQLTDFNEQVIGCAEASKNTVSIDLGAWEIATVKVMLKK